jgi:hypothetical protein
VERAESQAYEDAFSGPRTACGAQTHDRSRGNAFHSSRARTSSLRRTAGVSWVRIRSRAELLLWSSAARWCADPQTRKWRVALRTGRAARTNIGEALAALAALGDWIEAQALPGEEPEEQAGTFWGPSAGRVTSRGPGQVGV